MWTNEALWRPWDDQMRRWMWWIEQSQKAGLRSLKLIDNSLALMEKISSAWVPNIAVTTSHFAPFLDRDGSRPPQASPAPAPSSPILLDAPAGEVDDLLKIKGVGPKIKEILNSLGIYHFRQIAAWTPDQIEEKIDFKGRVARERWVEQARDFLS
jgi:hypothetical protein